MSCIKAKPSVANLCLVGMGECVCAYFRKSVQIEISNRKKYLLYFCDKKCVPCYFHHNFWVD